MQALQLHALQHLGWVTLCGSGASADPEGLKEETTETEFSPTSTHPTNHPLTPILLLIPSPFLLLRRLLLLLSLSFSLLLLFL